MLDLFRNHIVEAAHITYMHARFIDPPSAKPLGVVGQSPAVGHPELL